MPHNVMDKVWAYFDAVGPLTGTPWPIAYRTGEQDRLDRLRAMGVLAFPSLVYAHRPGMAAWLNDWAAQFAAEQPDVLHTATLFPEPDASAYVRRALDAGAVVWKAPPAGRRVRPARPAARRLLGPARRGRRAGRRALRQRAGARSLHRTRAASARCSPGTPAWSR